MARRRSNHRVLVTGGAGYIGSHVVLALTEANLPVVVADNLSAGRKEAVLSPADLVVGSIEDKHFVDQLICDYEIDSVIHMAGSVKAEESNRRPLFYYHNNFSASRDLIETCVRRKVESLVFSSTAAVYGEPCASPVPEDSRTAPLNPYGRSKLAVEWLLRDVTVAHGLRHVILRYFNVAGADPLARTGPAESTESQLIKVATEVALRRRAVLPIFGVDYPTADGTCVRDFVHVSDVAGAHLDALRYLWNDGESVTINCGYGRGFSVREVVQTLEAVIGAVLPKEERPRRTGDAAQVIADGSLIRARLGWTPAHNNLRSLIADTLRWEEANLRVGPQE